MLGQQVQEFQMTLSQVTSQYQKVFLLMFVVSSD